MEKEEQEVGGGLEDFFFCLWEGGGVELFDRWLDGVGLFFGSWSFFGFLTLFEWFESWILVGWAPRPKGAVSVGCWILIGKCLVVV